MGNPSLSQGHGVLLTGPDHTNIYQMKADQSCQQIEINKLIQSRSNKNQMIVRNRTSRTNQDIKGSRQESSRSYEKSYSRSRSFNTYTIDSKKLVVPKKRKESVEAQGPKRNDYYAMGILK